jgi:hypothetical protein
MIDARTGQSLTTGSSDAAEQYQLAVDRILGSETGAAEALDRALALDIDLALALAARYMLGKEAKSTDADVFAGPHDGLGRALRNRGGAITASARRRAGT